MDAVEGLVEILQANSLMVINLIAGEFVIPYVIPIYCLKLHSCNFMISASPQIYSIDEIKQDERAGRVTHVRENIHACCVLVLNPLKARESSGGPAVYVKII